MEFKNITIKSKNKTIFENQAIELSDDKINILSGPNGAGKTVLLGYLSGLYQKTQKSDAFFVPTIAILDYSLTVFENIEYLLDLLEVSSTSQAILEIAKHLNIEQYLDYDLLSISEGTKQKICLFAIFYKLNKKLLLIDEPFNYLDKASQKIITKQFKQKIKEGMIVVISDHRVSQESEQFKIIKINNQQIVNN